MSDCALDEFVEQTEFNRATEVEAEQTDWIEIVVRRVSRLAGYASLMAAVAGIAYLAIR